MLQYKICQVMLCRWPLSVTISANNYFKCLFHEYKRKILTYAPLATESGDINVPLAVWCQVQSGLFPDLPADEIDSTKSGRSQDSSVIVLTMLLTAQPLSLFPCIGTASRLPLRGHTGWGLRLNTHQNRVLSLGLHGATSLLVQYIFM
jgi:hypothetical protein